MDLVIFFGGGGTRANLVATSTAPLDSRRRPLAPDADEEAVVLPGGFDDDDESFGVRARLRCL